MQFAPTYIKQKYTQTVKLCQSMSKMRNGKIFFVVNVLGPAVLCLKASDKSGFVTVHVDSYAKTKLQIHMQNQNMLRNM